MRMPMCTTLHFPDIRSVLDGSWTLMIPKKGFRLRSDLLKYLQSGAFTLLVLVLCLRATVLASSNPRSNDGSAHSAPSVLKYMNDDSREIKYATGDMNDTHVNTSRLYTNPRDKYSASGKFLETDDEHPSDNDVIQGMSTPYVGTVNEEQKTSLEPGRWKSVRRQEDSPTRIDLYVSNLEPNTKYSIRSTNKLKSFGPNEYHLVTSNHIGDVYDDNFKVGWNDKGHFWILDKSDDEDGMYIGSVSGYRSTPTVYSYDPKENFFEVYNIMKPDDLVVDAPGLGFNIRNIRRYCEPFTYRVHFHFETDDKQITVKLFNCGVEVAKFAVSKPVFEYPNALDPTYVLDGDWKNLVGLTDTTTEHVVMRIIGGIVRGFSELIFKARNDKGLCKCTIKDVLIHCHWTDDNNVHLVKFVNNLNKLMESWKKPDDKWGLAFFQYTEEGGNKKAYPRNAILFDADEELSNALAVPSMQIPIIRGKRKISIMDVFIEVAQMKRIRINRNTFRTEVTKNYEEFCSHEYVGKRSIGQCDCEDPVICKLINHLFVYGVLYD
eukprot:411687_1